MSTYHDGEPESTEVTHAEATRENSGYLPQVTVVVPAYNAERFILRTLLTAVGQTYPCLNILVVDDGSTDATRAIVEDLARSHPNLSLVTTPNAGVARARNVGTELAESEYVAYLDADDLWHPTKIAKQIAALAAHANDPTWAASYVLYRRIDEVDMVVADGPSLTARGTFFGSHLVVNHVGNGSGLLVRRNAALQVGGFDPAYADRGIGGCEDHDFQLRLLSRYKLELVPEYLVGYRSHADAMSTNWTRMGQGQLAVIERHLTDPRVGPELRELARQASQRYAMTRFLRGRDMPKAWSSMRILLARAPFRTAGFLAGEIYGFVRGKARKIAAGLPGIGSRLDRRRRFDACDPKKCGFRSVPSVNRRLSQRLDGIDEEMQKASFNS